MVSLGHSVYDEFVWSFYKKKKISFVHWHVRQLQDCSSASQANLKENGQIKTGEYIPKDECHH